MRGSRRLIVGQNGEMYYTEDHYNSFQEVLLQPRSKRGKNESKNPGSRNICPQT